MLKRIEPMLENNRETKRWLSAMATVSSAEALKEVRPYLNKDQVAKEAALAMLQIGEAVVKQAPAQALQAAQQVRRAVESKDLRQRARKLEDQARTKETSAAASARPK
jgi:hypothetical protein